MTVGTCASVESGALVLGDARATSLTPGAGSAMGFGWGWGKGCVLGAEHPWAVSPGSHLGPSMSCSSAGGAKQPHIPAQTSCCANSLLQAGPGSVRLCTVKGGGDPAVPVPQPHHHPALQGHGHCWSTPRGHGFLGGTSADPGISSLPIQPLPRASRGTPAPLGTFSGHGKMR